MSAPAVRVAEFGPLDDPEPLAAELVTRCCGTRAPGVLELLDILGIDLSAGPPRECHEPVPVTWPNSYRRQTKGKGQH